MKKDEFQAILKQVKNELNGQLNKRQKTELCLTDKNKTIPFEGISNNVSSKGSYYLDSTEYPYKNETERIKVVREINEKIQQNSNELRKILIENQKAVKRLNVKLKGKKEKDREKDLKKIEKITGLDNALPLRQLSKPEYPVEMILKWDSKFPGSLLTKDNEDKETIYIDLDNKTMFYICLNNDDIFLNNGRRLKNIVEDSETTKQWNKTVLEYYKRKKVNKYREYEQSFIEWFEDKEIDIAKVDSLVEKHITVNGEPVKAKNLSGLYPKTKSKGGRPKDPELPGKKDKLARRYYRLTEQEGYKRQKAIKILCEEFPNWTKSTIEKYLK